MHRIFLAGPKVSSKPLACTQYTQTSHTSLRYRIEWIDQSQDLPRRSLTAAKVGKITLTTFAILSWGASISLISAAPLLVLPVLGLSFGALYLASLIPDHTQY